MNACISTSAALCPPSMETASIQRHHGYPLTFTSVLIHNTNQLALPNLLQRTARAHKRNLNQVHEVPH